MGFMKPQLDEFKQYTGDEYKVCGDCLQLIVNGELPPDDQDYTPPDCELNLTTKTTDDCGNEYLNEGSFSHSGCELCNDGLGNTVYTMVDCDSVQSEDKYRWRLSAPGYMDCTDWTVADSPQEAVDDCLGMYGDEFDEDDLRAVGDWLEGFDEFLEGYLLGLAFTGHQWPTEDCDNPDPLFGRPGMDIADCVDTDSELWAKLTEEQRLGILHDCLGFLSSAQDLIGDEYERAGSDFHLTRNRHGAGFWDGGWDTTNLLNPAFNRAIGKKLTDLARPYGTAELCRYGDEPGFTITN